MRRLIRRRSCASTTRLTALPCAGGRASARAAHAPSERQSGIDACCARAAGAPAASGRASWGRQPTRSGARPCVSPWAARQHSVPGVTPLARPSAHCHTRVQPQRITAPRSVPGAAEPPQRGPGQARALGARLALPGRCRRAERRTRAAASLSWLVRLPPLAALLGASAASSSAAASPPASPPRGPHSSSSDSDSDALADVRRSASGPLGLVDSSRRLPGVSAAPPAAAASCARSRLGATLPNQRTPLQASAVVLAPTRGDADRCRACCCLGTSGSQSGTMRSRSIGNSGARAEGRRSMPRSKASAIVLTCPIGHSSVRATGRRCTASCRECISPNVCGAAGSGDIMNVLPNANAVQPLRTTCCSPSTRAPPPLRAPRRCVGPTRWNAVRCALFDSDATFTN